MNDRTLKNQKKHINKTLKQIQLAKTMIQLSITGAVSVITASLSFYFCPGFSSQVVDEARSGICFVQTASHRKFQELENFFKKQNQTKQGTPPRTELSEDTSGIQGGSDTSSVTSKTSPVSLGKAENLDMENYQGNAVVNYTEREVPYTRIIEHKHFEFGKQEKTVISREYSSEWKVGDEPYYPVNDEKNGALYARYQELAAQEDKVIFGGRLGAYRYYDMDKVIEAALELVFNIF